jgi:hypothetical protein
MTVREIHDWLARGDATTHQRWERTTAAVYQALKRMGLQPNPGRRTMAAYRQRVRQLYNAGKSLHEIAELLNASETPTPNGRSWTDNAVYRALGLELGRDRYAQLHRELLADARRRGLTAKQTADEFNAKRVPRNSSRPWTADSVRLRRVFLNRAARQGRSVK